MRIFLTNPALAPTTPDWAEIFYGWLEARWPKAVLAVAALPENVLELRGKEYRLSEEILNRVVDERYLDEAACAALAARALEYRDIAALFAPDEHAEFCAFVSDLFGGEK